MEQLKEWCTFLCFAAVGCCAVGWLVPKNSIGRILHLLVLTFFLCSLVSPLLKLSGELSLDTKFLSDDLISEALDEKVTEQLQRQIATVVEQLVEEALSYREVKPKKVEVKTTTSSGGSICIEQVVIWMEKQEIAAARAAKQALEERLGTEVVIQADG